MDQTVIDQLLDCITQRGMGELLAFLPPFTRQEELTSIMMDSHEVKDQHPCETRFQLRIVCFQPVSDVGDVRQMQTVRAK